MKEIEEALIADRERRALKEKQSHVEEIGLLIFSICMVIVACII